MLNLSDTLYTLGTNILAVLSVLYLVYAVISVVVYIVFSKTMGNGQSSQWVEGITGQDYMLNNQGITKILLRLFGAVCIVAFVLVGGHYYVVTQILRLLVYIFGG